MAKPSTVLIADGDQSVIRLLKTVLANAGHRVVLATALEEILAKVAKNDVDVALVDFGLNGGRGIDVARKIVTDHPSVRVGMLSSFGTTRSAIAAQEAGIHRFLLKPFDDLAAVGRTIRELLGDDPAGLFAGFVVAGDESEKNEDRGPIRVIVADTSHDDRAEIRDALEALGCEVTTAICGQEALLRLSPGSHDVLVVSYDMGDMNADDILLRAQRVDADIAVVVTAVEPTLQMTTALLKRGAAAFIEKPLLDVEQTAVAILRQGRFVLDNREDEESDDEESDDEESDDEESDDAEESKKRS